MRGARKKVLCGRGMPGAVRREVKRLWRGRNRPRVASPDTGTRKKWPGNIAPHDFHGAVRTGHVLRGIEPYFRELSATGVRKALNLKFGPERKHGAPESLRAWPRGRPGQGRASRLPKPQLLAEIAGLQKYRNVDQTARF